MRILVTLTETAGDTPEILGELLTAGMDCARINCAHGTREQWIRTEQILAPPGARLEAGGRLLLTRLTPEPSDLFALQAQCSLSEALEQAAVGDHVWTDDGRAGCIVECRDPLGLVLRILSTRPSGEKLRSGKGLNFPDTELRLSPLTPKDRDDLDFVAEHADLVGYSFVQERADIELLQAELRARQAGGLAKTIVAKIETRKAVRNLPELIVAAAGRQPLAVMIARGDLAVEIGYERLAEIQEEILWLCEGAHVPVIWATQVLERLVKKGTPTRGEITDAAMGERAECVMLNKGPHVAAAVTILDDVLRRMEAHQTKKTPRLRALHSW